MNLETRSKGIKPQKAAVWNNRNEYHRTFCKKKENLKGKET